MRCPVCGKGDLHRVDGIMPEIEGFAFNRAVSSLTRELTTGQARRIASEGWSIDDLRSIGQSLHSSTLLECSESGRATSPSSRPGFHRVGPGAFVLQPFAGVACGVASCWRGSVAFVDSVS